MTNFINGVPVIRRVSIPKIDVNGIPVIETTGYIETTGSIPSIDYGINPCIWNALPTRTIALWKVKHPSTVAGAVLPVNIVIPTTNRRTTVSVDINPLGTTKIPVIDNKSTQVLGHDITVPSGTVAPTPQIQVGYITEHLVYIDKCCGIFRLMGVTAINSPAIAKPVVNSASKN